MNKVEVELFGKQWEAFNFTTQFAAAIGGVQSGKTFVGSCWAGKKINEFPGGIGIIAAPTYKILQQSTLVKLFTLFPQLRKYYAENKGQITLPTGGMIFTRSMDQPLGAEGVTANWIWGDEAGQMSRLAWTVFKSRVAMTGGQIFLTTTPYDLGWLYLEFYQPWQRKEDKRLSVYTWKSTDNPNFPKEHYEAEKKALSPEEFARRYEGEFTKMEGLVYDIPEDQIIDPIEINTKDIICGLDFGFTNPTAGVIIKVSNDNIFYVVNDELYDTGKTQDEIQERLKEIRQRIPFSQLYPDPAEPDRIEALKRAGFYIKTVDKDILAGINRVRELIRKRQLFIFKTCKNVLDESAYYHYDPEKIKEEPVKEKDHLMDALRYAIYNYSPRPVIEMKVYGGVKPLIPGIG
jgi:phage terminase large subunit